MGREQKVMVVIGALDKASGVFDGLTRGAMERFGHKITDLISNLPQMAGEMFKLGADAETASFRFTKFAGGIEEADEYLAAFQLGADGAVSKMDAMTSGARLLQMGIAENAEEMEFMAAAAIKLGDQTKASGDRIADWSAMLANQSIPRLDNFGISSGKVRRRIDELLASGQALSRDQAFKMAVMEEGSKALETLGDTSELMSTKIDKWAAAIDDAKMSIGELAVEAAADLSELDGYWGQVFSPSNVASIVDTGKAVIGLVGAIDKASRAASYGADFNTILAREVEKVQNAHAGLTDEVDVMTMRWRSYSTVQEDATKSMEGMSAESVELAGRLQRIDEAVADYNETWHAAEQIGWQAEAAMVDLADGINEAGSAADAAEWKAMALARSLGKMKAAAIENESALLDMTMNWMGFFDRNEEQAADWAAKQEDLETSHTERMKEIQVAGNAEMLASEQARYEEEKRMLDESLAAQEEAQRRSLGQNLLQSFESWARMKDIPADEMLEMRTAIAQEYGLIDDETANLITYMTGQWETWATNSGENTEAVLGNLDMYMERAGLASTATEEDVTAMVGDWGRLRDGILESKQGILESMDGVIGKVGDLTTALNEIPTTIDVSVVITQEMMNLGGGGLMEMQAGTRHFRGGMALIGEKGPELVRLPKGAEIWSAGETRGLMGKGLGGFGLGGPGGGGYRDSPSMATNTRTVGSHNVYNIYDVKAAEYIFERERRERREALTRMM